MRFEELYFCCHCCQNIKDANKLFLLDDSSKYFCSEDCGRKHFDKMVSYFEKLEKERRIKHSLEDEPVLNILSNKDYINQVLHNPTRITFTENMIGEKVYNFTREIIHDNKSVYISIICLVLEGSPTYIFQAIASLSKEFVDSFNFSQNIDNIDSFKTLRKTEDSLISGLDQETLDEIELKKSILLAELLEERKNSDLPFESFPHYLKFVDQTLENPDEIYEWSDSSGDELLVYIKALSEETFSFYLFIVAYQSEDFVRKQNILLPILIFPTVDSDLYSFYRRGRLVSGHFKN